MTFAIPPDELQASIKLQMADLIIEGLSTMEALAWAIHEHVPERERAATMCYILGRNVPQSAYNQYVFRARQKLRIQ